MKDALAQRRVGRKVRRNGREVIAVLIAAAIGCPIHVSLVAVGVSCRKGRSFVVLNAVEREH